MALLMKSMIDALAPVGRGARDPALSLPSRMSLRRTTLTSLSSPASNQSPRQSGHTSTLTYVPG